MSMMWLISVNDETTYILVRSLVEIAFYGTCLMSMFLVSLNQIKIYNQRVGRRYLCMCKKFVNQ